MLEAAAVPIKSATRPASTPRGVPMNVPIGLCRASCLAQSLRSSIRTKHAFNAMPIFLSDLTTSLPVFLTTTRRQSHPPAVAIPNIGDVIERIEKPITNANLHDQVVAFRRCDTAPTRLCIKRRSCAAQLPCRQRRSRAIVSSIRLIGCSAMRVCG